MLSENLSEVLDEFAQTMVTDFPIQGILDHLVRRIAEILPVTAAGVTLIAPDTQPRYVAASNGAALRFEKLQTDLAQGPCVAAYERGEPVSVPNLRTEGRFPQFASKAMEAGMAAVFTFPLCHGDSKPLGALDLYRDSPGALPEEAMDAAQTLANVAAAYLLKCSGPSRPPSILRPSSRSLASRRSDVDRFKDVNDTYGHQAGDELLVAVAKRLLKVIRPGDTLARLSGDEFVVLCEGLESASEAPSIVSRLEAAFVEPFALADLELHIGASIGVAFTDGKEGLPEALLRNADLAMYKAKRKRGERSNGFDLRELHRADGQVDLEQDLRDAVEANSQLHLEYQPIMTTPDGRIVGIEALLRWKHPSRGVIAPGVLIPLAERCGLIVEIGHWVLEQARSDQRAWHQTHASDLELSINVSAHQLMSVGFAKSVAAALADASIDPHLLTLEMTESVFVRDPERALTVLNDVKAMGVKLALDDFGTGYSSLSYLKRYPVDSLKIDQEFIAGLGRVDSSTTIVTAVVGLAHGLGMDVVGEDVETAEQHDRLIELGCDRCQGFYFARPMPAESLSAVLRQCAAENLSLPLPPASGARERHVPLRPSGRATDVPVAATIER